MFFSFPKKEQTAGLNCNSDIKQTNFPASILHFFNPAHYAASFNLAANMHWIINPNGKVLNQRALLPIAT